MSIQALIHILDNAEVDARKAHHLAHHINQSGANMETTDALETYARNALVSICNALREAEALKIEAEAERKMVERTLNAAVAGVAQAVAEKKEESK